LITGFAIIAPQLTTTNYAFFLIATNYSGLIKKLGIETKLVSTLSDGINTGFEDVNTSGSTVFSITGSNLPDLFYPQMLYVSIDQI